MHVRKNAAKKLQTAGLPEHVRIGVERSGEWMPVETLREAALSALQGGKDVIVDLEKLDHLDASALQILLALKAEQQRLGRQMRLEHVSPELKQWFEYAGAAGYFFDDGAEQPWT